MGEKGRGQNPAVADPPRTLCAVTGRPNRVSQTSSRVSPQTESDWPEMVRPRGEQTNRI